VFWVLRSHVCTAASLLAKAAAAELSWHGTTPLLCGVRPIQHAHPPPGFKALGPPCGANKILSLNSVFLEQSGTFWIFYHRNFLIKPNRSLLSHSKPFVCSGCVPQDGAAASTLEASFGVIHLHCSPSTSGYQPWWPCISGSVWPCWWYAAYSPCTAGPEISDSGLL
jgi:hypothetical protein